MTIEFNQFLGTYQAVVSGPARRYNLECSLAHFRQCARRYTAGELQAWAAEMVAVANERYAAAIRIRNER